MLHNKDFTVDHFANSKPGKQQSERIKKSASFTSTKLVMASDLAWDEKNLSDFDDITDDEQTRQSGSDDNDDQQQTSMTDVNSNVSGKKKCKKKKKTDAKTTPDDPSSPGVVYPHDLWCILGDYIAPEDVGVFARICQGSHIVTHTVAFWRGLYNRCVSCASEEEIERLPRALRPEHIDRIHGLRTRVIRALHYIHPVFIHRHTTGPSFHEDPDLYLRGRVCSLMFHQKCKRTRANSNDREQKWVFSFKFETCASDRKSVGACAYTNAKSLDRKKRRLVADDDIHINPQDGIYFLQVMCPNFMTLPSPMGLVLTQSALSVSGQGMRYHKLRLNFDHTLCTGGTNGTTLLLDPVLNVSVLPWWHPRYPYTSGT